MESVDVSIQWPFKWCLVGSSGSGKTVFSLDLIKHVNRLINHAPSKLVIIYKEHQEIYNEFSNYFPTELIHEEEADIDFITKDNKERLLLICDDLYYSKKLDDIAEQFLIKGRHRNTSWLVLTQSIFNRPALINISRNCNHITLFKSVRLNEPHIFFSQLRPKGSKVLQNIFAKATESSFSYIDIDLSQTCPDKYRYKSNLFDKFVEVFLIMNDNTFKKMYLVSESDLKSLKENKIPFENAICQEGVNIRVKPIKKKNNYQPKTNIDDNIENEKQKENVEVEKTNELGASNRDVSEEISSSENISNTDQPGEQDFPEISLGKENDINYNKRKPLPLSNDPYFQLNKAIKFTPYSFLSKNNKKRLLDEYDGETDKNEETEGKRYKLTNNNEAEAEAEKNEENDTSKKDEIDNTQNQWINGIKSKVNDRKVQFKRKRNNVGYRVAPNDVKNSLIKPSDFKFLTPKESESFAWEIPDEIQQKKIRNNFINEVGKEKNKRFRLY